MDASIWLTSFVKAMRDGEGETLANAHLLGTFRRVLRLLFYRIRPIFVFDGGAPQLKRRTVLLRAQRRATQAAQHGAVLRRLVLGAALRGRIVARLHGSDGGGRSSGGSGSGGNLVDATAASAAVSAATAVDDGGIEIVDDSDEEEAVTAVLLAGRGDATSDEDVYAHRSKEVSEVQSSAAESDDGIIVAARGRVSAIGGSSSQGGGDAVDDDDGLENKKTARRPKILRLRVAGAKAPVQERARIDDDASIDTSIAAAGSSGAANRRGGEGGGGVQVTAERSSEAAAPAGTNESEDSDSGLAAADGGGYDIVDEGGSESIVLPGTADSVDLASVMALPPSMQKAYLEELQRKRRNEARARLLPVAADPRAFSRTQIAGFLRSAQFNLDVDRHNAAQAAVAAGHGRRIDSEAGRVYMLLTGDAANAAANASAAAARAAAGGGLPDDGSTIRLAQVRAMALRGDGDGKDDAGEAAAGGADGGADVASYSDAAALSELESQLLSKQAAVLAGAKVVTDASTELTVTSNDIAARASSPSAAAFVYDPASSLLGGGWWAAVGANSRSTATSATAEAAPSDAVAVSARGADVAEAHTEMNDLQKAGLFLGMDRSRAQLAARAVAQPQLPLSGVSAQSQPKSAAAAIFPGLRLGTASAAAPAASLGAGFMPAEPSLSAPTAAFAWRGGRGRGRGRGSAAASAARSLGRRLASGRAGATAVIDSEVRRMVAFVNSGDPALLTAVGAAAGGGAPVGALEARYAAMQAAQSLEASTVSSDGSFLLADPAASRTTRRQRARDAIGLAPAAHGEDFFGAVLPPLSAGEEPQLDAASAAGVSGVAAEVAVMAQVEVKEDAAEASLVQAEAVPVDEALETAEEPAPEDEAGFLDAELQRRTRHNDHSANGACTGVGGGDDDGDGGGSGFIIDDDNVAMSDARKPVAGSHPNDGAPSVWDTFARPLPQARPAAPLPVPESAPERASNSAAADASEDDREEAGPVTKASDSGAVAADAVADSEKETLSHEAALEVSRRAYARLQEALAIAAAAPAAAVPTSASSVVDPDADVRRGNSDIVADAALVSAVQLVAEPLAPPPTQQHAASSLVEAYSLAGSMRSWAQPAFARALRSIGVQLPPIAAAGGVPNQTLAGGAVAQPAFAVALPAPNDVASSRVAAASALPLSASALPLQSLTEPMRMPPSELQTPEAAASSVATSKPVSSFGFSARSEPIVPGGSGSGGRVPASGDEAASAYAALAALEQAEGELRLKARAAARDGATLTDGMRDEVIALLRAFGLPCMIAPMEAEAQCAELERAGLVSGVVSDDSDCFLFGARTVFRHIFDDRHFVEVYTAADIEREIGLSRDDLVRAALLLGSDYTDGVKGVGPVNAVEILHAFPGDEGLADFRTWLTALAPEDIAPSPPPTRRRCRRPDGGIGGIGGDTGADVEDVPAAAIETPADVFKRKHQAARRNWVIGESFPDKHVLAAYRHPRVTPLEAGRHAFVFEVPRWDALRALCTDTFGWDARKAEAELSPVIRELSAGAPTQTTMESYLLTYADTQRSALIKSARLRAAVTGKTGGALPQGIVVVDGDLEGDGERTGSAKKRAAPSAAAEGVVRDVASAYDDADEPGAPPAARRRL